MIRGAALLLALVQLAACGGGSDGGGGGSTFPPSNLSYPAPPPYTVGASITPLAPTVTGLVARYAVSPSLPAGLSLSAATGDISGTPTAVSPETTYTVTASNGSGSTTADVAIEVVGAGGAPMVSYPSLAYTLTAGTAANIAAISTGGAVATWMVTPALPAGLTINAATGAITGTPTAVTLPASYVVSAKNSSGTYKVGVTLHVVSKILLDLGHNAPISQLAVSGTRLLSQAGLARIDERAEYRCNLWDTTTDTLVIALQCTGQIALAGSTAVIVGPTPSVNGLEVLAASTGALQARITTPYSWWQLASDGSYIVLGSATGLSVFSPTGQSLYSAAGNYAAANVFAAPGQILIALGPAGANVIQTVTIPGGISQTLPAFTGTFNEWFSDGSHFQTTVGTSVYTYSSASVRVDLTILPTAQELGGEGNYFWAFTGMGFSIYTVGASATPTLNVTTGGAPAVVSGTTIALGTQGDLLTIIDLAGATPVAQTYTLPAPVSGGVVAVSSPSDWFVGASGLIFDGTSIATTPKYLDYGQALSLAGGGGYAAVATALGIVVINVETNTIQVTIPFVSNNVQISASGTVLAAGGADGSGNALNTYSLPSGSLIHSFPYPSGPQLYYYTLAPTGTLIAQVMSAGTQVTAVTGGPVLWSVTQTLPEPQNVLFSPDATLIALSDGDPDDINSTQQAMIGTNIYQNYALTETVAGWAVGWINNSELLTNTYTYSPQDSPDSLYAGSKIYSPTGTVVATPSLPQSRSLVPVNAEGSEVYSPALNSIYSMPSGDLVFGSSYYSQSGFSENMNGVFASPYIVYMFGSHVVALQPPQ